MAHTSESGVRISYDDMGNGEPSLLFMPGWCANRTGNYFIQNIRNRYPYEKVVINS